MVFFFGLLNDPRKLGWWIQHIWGQRTKRIIKAVFIVVTAPVSAGNARIAVQIEDFMAVGWQSLAKV